MFATIVAVAAISGFIGYSKATTSSLNALVLANVEALTNNENPTSRDVKEKDTSQFQENDEYEYDKVNKVTIHYYTIVTIVDCFGEGSIKCTPECIIEDCVEYDYN